MLQNGNFVSARMPFTEAISHKKMLFCRFVLHFDFLKIFDSYYQLVFSLHFASNHVRQNSTAAKLQPDAVNKDEMLAHFQTNPEHPTKLRTDQILSTQSLERSHYPPNIPFEHDQLS